MLFKMSFCLFWRALSLPLFSVRMVEFCRVRRDRVTPLQCPCFEWQTTLKEGVKNNKQCVIPRPCLCICARDLLNLHELGEEMATASA